MATLKILHACSKPVISLQLKCTSHRTSTSKRPLWNSLKFVKSSYHSLSRQNTVIHNPIFNPQKQNDLSRSYGLPINKPCSIFCTRGLKVDITGHAVENIYFPTPVEVCYETLEKLHDVYALPWWLTIITSTVVLRFALIAPLAILHQKVMAKIEGVQIEINTYAEQVKQQTAVMAKEHGWSQREMADVYSKQISEYVTDVHNRENCRPFRLFYVSAAHIFSWVTMTRAIGQMTGAHPQLFGTEVDIDFLPSLLSGGTLWFTDLVQHDLVLPFLFGASNILLVLLWSLRRGPLTRTQHRLQFFMFFLSIGLVPVAITMPSAVTLYWATSSLCGLGQFFVLRIPAVRRFLRIPLVPSEMKHPLQEMKQIFKIRFRSKKYF